MPKKILKTLCKSEEKRLIKLTELETKARAQGYRCIAGVDEAGRGPLAGPVVAAACCIPEKIYFAGINDSKQLPAQSRKKIYEQIVSHAEVYYGIGIVDHTVIDTINILQATLKAMRKAVYALPVEPDFVLVDGINTFLEKIPSQAVIRGDSLCQMIAAASIIAKETRDQIMVDFHTQFPEYGFDVHKGYATLKHRLALAKYGPSPIHRRSFHRSKNSM